MFYWYENKSDFTVYKYIYFDTFIKENFTETLFELITFDVVSTYNFNCFKQFYALF